MKFGAKSLALLALAASSNAYATWHGRIRISPCVQAANDASVWCQEISHHLPDACAARFDEMIRRCQSQINESMFDSLENQNPSADEIQSKE